MILILLILLALAVGFWFVVKLIAIIFAVLFLAGVAFHLLRKTGDL